MAIALAMSLCMAVSASAATGEAGGVRCVGTLSVSPMSASASISTSEPLPYYYMYVSLSYTYRVPGGAPSVTLNVSRLGSSVTSDSAGSGYITSASAYYSVTVGSAHWSDRETKYA